jgi:hypothetical protein
MYQRPKMGVYVDNNGRQWQTNESRGPLPTRTRKSEGSTEGRQQPRAPLCQGGIDL